MRYHEPTYPIRTTFQYNNYMYMLAGYIAEVLEGEEWERMNTNRLFKPLGMTSSRYVRDITDDTDFAEAYTLSNNRLVKVRQGYNAVSPNNVIFYAFVINVSFSKYSKVEKAKSVSVLFYVFSYCVKYSTYL